ncbi:hypothetical protein FRC01_010967 [Tulasnella sp. 417]|nr:hypothetical protein FRC01_010967 [Tulasnella sp. 417]
MEVKKRLGKESENWKKVDGLFVQYEGFTSFSGVPALITDFIEGTPAKEYLEKKSAKDKRRLILEFAHGLKTLHSQNLSHGTIKPCHFMVDRKGKAKVGGYCFNRMVEEEFEKLYPGEDNRGSARYVAPEFLETRKTDQRMDVYSFALVAMKLLTGVKPFASISQETSLVSRAKQEEPPFAEDVAQDDAWRAVLSSCWAKEPESRPSMERLYEESKQESGGAAAAPSSLSEQTINSSPTTSKDQVDDQNRLIRRGYAVTNYPLLDLYVGEMKDKKDKKHTQVALTALRSIGKRTHNDTFNQWRTEVKKRLGKEFEDWKKVDSSFVQYEGLTSFSGVPALITEFIESTPAKEHLEKKQAKDKRRLILEFARALKTLHGQNLSHGTIEPCHFMVDKKGKAKVGGYCFNRMVEEEFEKLHPPGDYRELLTGVQPFASVSQEASLIGRVKQGEPPFAEDVAQDDAWRAVLSSCWVKELEARPSMERLYEELSKTIKK